MCESPEYIGSIVATFFIGYIIGTFMCFLPDDIGRKKTMALSWTMNLIGTTMIVWGTDIHVV